ncbi:MAG: hypothetical protein ACXWG1_16210 [Usitatibacter sp.]
MRTRVFQCAAIVLLIALEADAAAQMMPRRERGGSQRESSSQPQKREAAPGVEPFAALERELPSLNVDLLLNADQLALWRVFERDVRDVAEMDRAQRRHLLALREGGEREPTAPAMIASLAEDGRMKSGALADLERHLAELYATLDDRQKRTLDRRVVMSQTEPLGR